VLDDFATKFVDISFGGTLGAHFFQFDELFIVHAPGVVVTIALVAADCQTCNASQNRSCGSFFTQCRTLFGTWKERAKVTHPQYRVECKRKIPSLTNS